MTHGQGVALRISASRIPFEERLGADLWTVVQQAGTLVEASLVTTIRSRDVDRACFRLRFGDGRVLKGRRVETLAQADGLEALARLLDPRYFPAVLARRGRALLTEWIDGTRLRPVDCTPDVVRFFGTLHASLHRTPVPSVSEWRRRSEDWRPKLEQRVQELVDAHALDGAAARLACQLAERDAPERVTNGLCHGDLCAENIIKDRSGRCVVVDNDSVAIDAYGYDLARTWHRWPMSQRQHAAYVEGYGRHLHWTHFTAHFLHWAILVLVDAASFRTRVGVKGARRPLNKLRTLLATSGRFGATSRAVDL